MLRKSLLAGAATLALVGSSLVYAQQQQAPGADAGRAAPSATDQGAAARMGERRPFALSPEDRAAFLDARIAGLKAGLQLTPDQEKNWPAFETALRDLAKLRAERMAARMTEQREPQPQQPNPVDGLRRRGEAMTRAGTALKQLADAEEPLLNSLNDAQKRRFFIMQRFAQHRMAMMRGEREFAERGGPDRERMQSWRERFEGWRRDRELGRAYGSERRGFDGPRGGPDGRGQGDGGWRGRRQDDGQL